MRKINFNGRFSEISFRKLMIAIGRLTANRETFSKVVFDFNEMEGIEVGGVTAIANSIEYLKSIGKDAECINVERCEAYQFLRYIGFAASYSKKTTTTPSNRTFLKLRPVTYTTSSFFLDEAITPWLAEHLECKTGALSSVKNCFTEIFNNIRDHSEKPIGHVCGHVNKERRKIFICVADFGVGIPRNVRNKERNIKRDCDAIERACDEGFSIKSTPGNMGAGLASMIRTIVIRNSGIIRIFSGFGRCRISKVDGEKHIDTSRAPFCPGTTIYIEIDIDKFIPSSTEEEEFSW